MIALLDDPGFFMSYAVIQALVVLLLIRFLDLYEREPLSLVALAALWGATGAAAISLVGNEALRNTLGTEARLVFGDAISAPLVEESAKGLALLALVGPAHWLGRRLGVAGFEGLTDGIVYGAAVGVGFAFTEDFFFFLERARSGGLEAGLDVFMTRRDFFGPAVLHHPIFTAAFGAGLGLATWTTRRLWRIVFPLLGLSVAILVHAVNNGFVELVLVLRYGLGATASWVQGAAFDPAVVGTAESLTRLMRVLDYWYVIFFLAAIAWWLSYQRKIIRATLAEEVDAGLLSRQEWEDAFRYWRRSSRYWQLLRSGQLEQWRHVRRVHRELIDLAMLKWRVARFGGDRGRVQRARRELATLSTFEVRPSNVPVPSTPLVGRETELAEAQALLLRPDTRVLTLTGPGGTGKSRLAIAIAAEVADRFGAGVFFVALAPVTNPDLVVTEIAQSLGVREAPGEPLLETVKDYLRDKQLLLVLDNMEQVLAAAPAVADLLAEAPRLRILATSREALDIRGEHEYDVQPLSLPAAGAASGADAAARHGAVALFLERARAVDPSFTLTEENAPAVVSICRRLDGLPLAIELAAARTELLTPQAMLERLEEPLDLLTGGARDLPARQRTLRAAIDWSYGLLEPDEQKLLARLGVFVGGCSLEAAEAVCRNGSAAHLLDPLESLVEQNLLRREAASQPRFTMLETIREYALERLRESGEGELVEQRHAQHYLALAEAAEAEIRGPRQAEWVERLRAEHDNLRAALARSLEAGEAELAARVAAALGRFWELRGTLAEARTWLERAVGADGRLREQLRAKALYTIGRLALLQADYDPADSALAEALQLFRAAGDAPGVVVSLWELGWIALVRGDYGRAQPLFEESLALARQAGDDRNAARALTSVGRLLAERGERARARELLQEGLAVRRGLGDRRDIASSLSNLGRLALLEGSHEEAKRLLDESTALARELDDKLRLAEALYFRGLIALEANLDAEAKALFVERFALSRALGDQLGIAECLDAVAAMAVRDGTADGAARAVRLLAAAERLRESIEAEQWPFERTRCASVASTARSRLGAARFEEARLEGRAMSRERAVSYALEPAAALAV